MSTGDIITIILTLIGSGVVVTIGGYNISVGVSKAINPVINQVNALTTALTMVNSDVAAHEVALNAIAPATDINLLAGNVYDGNGNLVFSEQPDPNLDGDV